MFRLDGDGAAGISFALTDKVVRLQFLSRRHEAKGGAGTLGSAKARDFEDVRALLGGRDLNLAVRGVLQFPLVSSLWHDFVLHALLERGRARVGGVVVATREDSDGGRPIAVRQRR